MMMKIWVCQSISENNRNSFLSFVFEVFPLEKALRAQLLKKINLHTLSVFTEKKLKTGLFLTTQKGMNCCLTRHDSIKDYLLRERP